MSDDNLFNLILNKDRNSREKGTVSLSMGEHLKMAQLAIDAATKFIFEPGFKADKKEEQSFFFLRQKLVPLLHSIAKEKNLELYTLYQGNLCRQTAFFTVYCLQKLMPNWEWEMYEADYTAEFFGKEFETAHAFAFGKKGKEKRVIDVADKFAPDMWVKVPKLEYPTIGRGRDNIKVLELRKCNLANCYKVERDILGPTKDVIKNIEITLF